MVFITLIRAKDTIYLDGTSMNLREHWEQIAQQDIEFIKEKILTGYLDGKPFTPVTFPKEMLTILMAEGKLARVLDFGCGLGRNFPALREISFVVEGYDLPQMIEKCRTVASADFLGSDWDSLRKKKYDLILAAIVLQHLRKEELDRYLDDMRVMTSYLAVPGRGRSDDKAIDIPLWDYIVTKGYERAYERKVSDTHRWCLFCPKP